jgi:hypothetical protein
MNPIPSYGCLDMLNDLDKSSGPFLPFGRFESFAKVA